MSFDYNSSGLRTQKTVNGETKQYFYSGDLLVSEYDGVEYMNFTYSPNGEAVGFSFLDAEENEILDYYIYLKNIQGDIIGLIDFKGEIHCTYSYDAWGKFLGAYDKNGNEITNPNSVALSNPLRYRGYYYDTETGLYYLNSRYYNPEWGTFICADGYVSTGEQIVAKNMYAYCGNNPVNRVDPTGCFWKEVRNFFSSAWNGVKTWARNTFGAGSYVSGSKKTETSSGYYGPIRVSTGTKSVVSIESGALDKPICSYSKTSVSNISLGVSGGIKLNFSNISSAEIELGFGLCSIETSFSYKNDSYAKEFAFSYNPLSTNFEIEITDAVEWDPVSGASYENYSGNLALLVALAYSKQYGYNTQGYPNTVPNLVPVT